MTITIKSLCVETLYPVTREVGSVPIAGKLLGDWVRSRLAGCDGEVKIRADVWLSIALGKFLLEAKQNVLIRDPADGEILISKTISGGKHHEAPLDPASFRIRFPWQLLTINEELISNLTDNLIEGTIRDGVTIDGIIHLGKGSVILPGVYIEGNAVFGENCKIGPNCYIRGNTSTGAKCHIGQAVEIKNTLIFDQVSIGHLSYVGDSVICDRVNFGAGTIVSNLRHDGKNHRWKLNGELVDTGRRKFGAIIGEGVHTGIHSAIYPGRMLPPGCSTIPGEVISK